MVPIFLLLLTLISLPAAAQESGWVDSAGYRQQMLKTGAIKQISYSPDGATLWSIGVDSLWRVYSWDAGDGKLLRTTTIDKTPYNPVLSVTISADFLTYTVCASALSDRAFHVKIYSLQTDSLLYDVVLNVKEVHELSAVFDSTLRVVKIFYVSYNTYGYPPNGICYGGTLEYGLTASTPELLRSESGAAKKWSVAAGKNIAAWIGFYHKMLLNYKGEITENTLWMKTFLWNDTLKIQNDLPFDITGQHPGYSEYAQNYYPLISSDGKHFFLIDHKTIRHWSLTPYGPLLGTELPFPPTFAIPSPSNTHLLISSGKQILLYHIRTNVISDSLNLPFNCTTATIRLNSKMTVFGSDDGYLRLMTLPFSPPNIPNDFHVDQTKIYTDSALTFSVITGKTIAHYKWDFGDSTTGDTTETAVHRYVMPGNYTVQLLLTDTSGISDTIIKKNFITILPHLVPAFSATPRFGKAPLNVQFTDESQGAITSWKWDFGDKQKDSVQHPKHIFTGRRYYNISLTITDGFTTATLARSAFITADTIPTDTFRVVKRWASEAKNWNNNDGNWAKYENAIVKGFLGTDGSIYLHGSECYTQSERFKGSPNNAIFFVPRHTIYTIDSLYQWKNIVGFSPSDIHYGSTKSCPTTNNAYQIIRYRSGFVTSFIGWTEMFKSMPSSLYFSSGRTFAPSGWTHDFDGTFLPDGTDIFLFRNGNTSSLQFFRQDSVLIAKDSLVGDVMRPFAIADSQRVLIISNPYIGTGDSSRWLILRSYFADGRLIEERQKFIEKGRYIRLLDAANLGNGEFLICGRGSQLNSTGGIDTMAYLAKISAGGHFIWEYLTPTWKQFQILQKLNTQYYGVSGQPYSGFYQGFTAFNTDGTILSDNRLGGVSSSFSFADFVVGKGNDELWFMGSENVLNEGQRAAIYLCNNPTETLTGLEVIPTSFSDKLSAEVFPLPAIKEITVRVSVPHQGRLQLSVVSALGVEQFLTERETNIENTFHISTDGLSAGIYGIQIRLDKEQLIVPAIILR